MFHLQNSKHSSIGEIKNIIISLITFLTKSILKMIGHSVISIHKPIHLLRNISFVCHQLCICNMHCHICVTDGMKQWHWSDQRQGIHVLDIHVLQGIKKVHNKGLVSESLPQKQKSFTPLRFGSATYWKCGVISSF